MYLSRKSRLQKHHTVRSPVQSYTELGFYSPKQQQTACYWSNIHTYPKVSEHHPWSPIRNQDRVLLLSIRLVLQLLDYLLEFPFATLTEVCYIVHGPDKKPVRSRQNPGRCGKLPGASAPFSFLQSASAALSNGNTVCCCREQMLPDVLISHYWMYSTEVSIPMTHPYVWI